MDRRQIITRLPLLGLAGAVPTSALAAVQSPMERIEHCAQQLVEAMADLPLPGQWEVAIRNGDANQAWSLANVVPAVDGPRSLRRFQRLMQTLDPSIAAWSVDYLPDHWSGVRFQCHGVTQEAVDNALGQVDDRFGIDRLGFNPHIRDFVDLAGRKLVQS